MWKWLLCPPSVVAVVTCSTEQVCLPTASYTSSLRCLSYSDHPSCRGTRCGPVLSTLCGVFPSPSQGDSIRTPRHRDTVCSRHWCTRDSSSYSVCPSPTSTDNLSATHLLHHDSLLSVSLCFLSVARSQSYCIDHHK